MEIFLASCEDFPACGTLISQIAPHRLNANGLADFPTGQSQGGS
jgi:hypothetical protein